MTLEQLKRKYILDRARFEPNPNCKFCKGEGERPIASRPEEMTFCICLFVDHSMSDELGTVIGKVARKELKALKERKPDQ